MHQAVGSVQGQGDTNAPVSVMVYRRVNNSAPISGVTAVVNMGLRIQRGVQSDDECCEDLGSLRDERRAVLDGVASGDGEAGQEDTFAYGGG
jgi:hypothetical protein